MLAGVRAPGEGTPFAELIAPLTSAHCASSVAHDGASACESSSATPPKGVRFALQLTLGREAHTALEQLVELFRHQNPSGDFTLIIERALCELLKSTMKRRFAQANAPQPRLSCKPTNPEEVVQAQRALLGWSTWSGASSFAPKCRSAGATSQAARTGARRARRCAEARASQRAIALRQSGQRRAQPGDTRWRGR